AVDLGLAHPPAHRFGANSDFAASSLAGRRQIRVFLLMLGHQTHRTRLHLSIDSLRHNQHPFKLKKMRHQTWGDSNQPDNDPPKPAILDAALNWPETQLNW